MITITENLVHANGIDIHVTESGDRDAPPLLLLHGGLVSSNPIWEPTPIAYNAYVPGLATQFRVIAPDERGSGRTTHSGGPISMSLLADDVAALVEALALERPAIAGFSAGGLTATIFGIRHPGVARAIINDAGYDCLNPRANSFAMLRQMLGGSPEAAEADPDAAAAFFASQPDMAPMFEAMKADQDAGGGSGQCAPISPPRSSEPPNGRATPSTTSPPSTYRRWCWSATGINSARSRKVSPRIVI